MKNDDIIFSKDGSLGNPALIKNLDKKATINGTMMLLRVNENICPNYMYQILRTNYFHRFLNMLISGSSIPHIFQRDIIKLKFPITTYEEQEKIADFLTAIDRKIALMEKKRLIFHKIKKYFLSYLFCNKQNIPELRFPEFEGEWNLVKTKQIGKIFTGNTPSTKEKDNYSQKGFLWITPGDITSSKYVIETEKKLSTKGFENSRKAPTNSVFVTCIGATIGKICINKEECCCNQQLNCIVPNEDYDKNFIYYSISKNVNKLKLYAGNTATPILNKNDFSNLKYYFCSLEEQEKIGKFLSNIDRKIELMEKEIGSNIQFKQSLLSKLFC